MQNNRISLILDYLKFHPNENTRKKQEEHLLENQIDPAEIQEMAKLFHNLGEIPVPEPDANAKERFHNMLEEEKARLQYDGRHPGHLSWTELLLEKRRLAIAAAMVGIFFMGWLAGSQLSSDKEYKKQVTGLLNEVHITQKMLMLALLEQPSATDRLKAINISSKIPQADNSVVDALLNSLDNDPDVNVRLVALDALFQLAANPRVRVGLIQSITRQESPIVQVSLANTMVQLREKRSVKELQKLLDNNNLDESVRTELQNSIHKLI